MNQHIARYDDVIDAMFVRTKGRGNNKLPNLACLFCAASALRQEFIKRLCAPCRALNLHKNPAQSRDSLLFPLP